MDDIKIFRLQSGEDIICSFVQEEDTITVMNPMLVLFKRHVSGKAMMILLPWLPMEIIENNIATLYNQDVLTVLIPKESLIQYYKKSLDCDLNMDNDFDFESNLEEASEDDYSFEEVLEEQVQESVKKVYH